MVGISCKVDIARFLLSLFLDVPSIRRLHKRGLLLVDELSIRERFSCYALLRSVDLA